MTTPSQNATPPAASDDRNLINVDESYLAPSFEDRLRFIWAKHSRTIIAACAAVLGTIVAVTAYDIIAARHQKAVAADYAAAVTDAQLRTFASNHPEHTLGGLAQLRLADQAYSSAEYSKALPLYERAAGILKSDALGARARLGAAVSAIQSGALADGEAALKQISTDIALPKFIRAEATYHLAGLAASAGRTEEARRLVEQVTTTDGEGQWAERASLLQATLPVASPATSASETKAEAVPAVSFK